VTPTVVDTGGVRSHLMARKFANGAPAA
jgi:hypothetical protein